MPGPRFNPLRPFSIIGSAQPTENATDLLRAMPNGDLANGLELMANDVEMHPSENQLIVLTLREAANRLRRDSSL